MANYILTLISAQLPVFRNKVLTRVQAHGAALSAPL